MGSDGNSTASNRIHKKGGRAKWYAVVQGRTPGVYSTWGDAWSQTDGHSNTRPYKFYSSFHDAVECFMRWRDGKQIHGHQSTMSMRGEVFSISHSGFFGNMAAEHIRQSAHTHSNKHSIANPRTHQTQDKLVKAQFSTESVKAIRKESHRSERPAEEGEAKPKAHQYATTSKGEASGQPRAKQEKVGGGFGDVFRTQERRIEDLTSLVQRLSRLVEDNDQPHVTSAPTEEAGITRPAISDSRPTGHGDGVRVSQNESRDSSLGSGTSSGNTENTGVRPNAGESLVEPSPTMKATPVRHGDGTPLIWGEQG